MNLNYNTGFNNPKLDQSQGTGGAGSASPLMQLMGMKPTLVRGGPQAGALSPQAMVMQSMRDFTMAQMANPRANTGTAPQRAVRQDVGMPARGYTFPGDGPAYPQQGFTNGTTLADLWNEEERSPSRGTSSGEGGSAAKSDAAKADAVKRDAAKSDSQAKLKAQSQPQVTQKQQAPAKSSSPEKGPADAKPRPDLKAKPQVKPQQPSQPQAKQAPAAAKPTGPAFDAGKAATSLHKAMHGGLFGAGTDEDAIFKSLQGKSPQEVQQVRKIYKEHYGKDLDSELKSELSGKDLSRAQALMKGDKASATATALRQAMGGLGTDEKAIYSALDGTTAKEREQISKEYQKQTGRTLQTDLKSDLSKSDLDRANALMKGDKAKAAAAEIKQAMAGIGTDETAIMKTLESKNKDERQAIVENYKKLYGKDLNASLGSELSGSELTQARALLKGDTAKADAAQLRNAMAGLGTDEDAINSVFEGKSQAERAKISEAYRQTYGSDLKQALGKELSGNDLEKANSLLAKGKLSSVQELKFAMEGMGTDEAAITQALQGKSKEEIAQIKVDYKKQTGRDLNTDLGSELTGRDLFDTNQAMKGQPTTLAEKLERVNESHQYERGGKANSVGRGMVDLFSDHGERLDRSVAGANDSHRRYLELQAAGRTEEAAAERRNLEKLMGFSDADVESVREAKDSASDVAGTVAATAAGVAVIAVTAGTATPLVAAGLAAAAGGSARTLVSGAIQGDAYGSEQAFTDFGRGAIDGGTAIIGAGTGRAATAVVKEGAEVAATRGLSTTVRQGIKEGVTEGAVGGGAGALLDEKTWDGDFAQGLTNVGTNMGLGMAAGGVAGGGMTKAMESGGAALRRLRETPLGKAGGDAPAVLDDVAAKATVQPGPDQYLDGLGFLDDSYPGVIEKLRVGELKAAELGYTPALGEALQQKMLANPILPNSVIGDGRASITAKAAELVQANPSLASKSGADYNFNAAQAKSEQLADELRAMFPESEFPGLDLATRAKAPKSLNDKMAKMAAITNDDFPLAKLTDTVGGRVDAPDLETLGKMAKLFEEKYGDKLVTKDDYFVKPGANGYRALHYIVDLGDRMAEVQMTTKGMRATDLATHDTVYKALKPVTPEQVERLTGAADRLMFVELSQ